jgi:hypothetical protein
MKKYHADSKWMQVIAVTVLRSAGVLFMFLLACGPSRPSPEAAAQAPAITARDASHRVDGGPVLAATNADGLPPALDGAPAHHVYDAVLGRPCAAAGDVGDLCAICDRHGRTVGVIMPGDFLYLQGDDVIRRSPDVQDQSPHRLLYAMAVDGSTLRAQVLTCPGCRRQIGWSLIVSLAGLAGVEPAIRQRIQGALGWPAEPLLGDAHAFRTAVASAPPAGSPPACAGGLLR